MKKKDPTHKASLTHEGFKYYYKQSSGKKHTYRCEYYKLYACSAHLFEYVGESKEFFKIKF